MTVSELMAILQKQDPLCTVVMRDSACDTGFVPVRDIDSLTMRAYARKGMLFYSSFGSEVPRDGKTDVFDEVVHGVLLE